MKIRGRLPPEGDVPFESEGSLSITPQGEIRFRNVRSDA
jgi:hypothetical protein